MNELVLIALTLDAAFSLREITGTPRAIQIVKCDQTILHVGARAHFGRAAHQDAHLTLRTFANSSRFLTSVLASWMNAICSGGIPASMSF